MGSAPGTSTAQGTTARSAPSAIILAAGKGTRMNSDLPKVLHEVGDRPMVRAVVDACRGAGCGRIVVVVGYKRELVESALAGERGVEFAVQDQQLGTGHAVRCCEGLFARESREPGHDVFVLCGDGPLIRSETLALLLDRHRAGGSSATLATSVIDDPTGYGRIVRDAAGRFVAIVEHKDCTPEQRGIREVNPSYYCFDAQAMFAALSRVRRAGSSGEYYLTAVPELLRGDGLRVGVIEAVPPEDVLSINTPEDLAVVDRLYRERRARAAARRTPARVSWDGPAGVSGGGGW